MKLTTYGVTLAISCMGTVAAAGNLQPNAVLWSESGTGRINSIQADGTASDFAISGLNGPADVEVDFGGQKVYWADSSNRLIQRANFDGTAVETLISAPPGSSPWGIALDVAGNRLFYSDYVTGSVYAAALNGAEPALLFSLADVRDVDFDARDNSLYVAGGTGRSLYRTNASGNSPLAIVYQATASIRFLDLDHSSERLFWTTFGSPGEVLMGSRDGLSAPVVLDATAPSASGVAYNSDNDTLYWIENTSEVHRLVLSGGTPGIFVVSSDTKQGLSLARPNQAVPEPAAVVLSAVLFGLVASLHLSALAGGCQAH